MPKEIGKPERRTGWRSEPPYRGGPRARPTLQITTSACPALHPETNARARPPRRGCGRQAPFAALSAVLAALVTAGGAAPAAAKPKVMVFPVVPLPGEVELAPAKRMTRAILAEMGQQEAYEAIAGEAPAATATAPDSARRPARSGADYRGALAQLADGAKQAQHLRFPQAIRELRKGIEGLTRNLDQLDQYDRLVDAYRLLAVCYFRRGKQAAGADVLEQLARLRPELQLDPGEYPPVFLSVFDQARVRALGRSPGTLQVTSAPAGAEVTLNGKRIGSTPLVVEEMIPGVHHLVVRMGDNAWAQVVSVREGQTSDSHADLGAGGPEAPVTMGDAIAANRFDNEVRKTARQIGRSGGADYVLVTAMGLGESMFALSGFLGNVRDGTWTSLAARAPDLDLLSDSIEAHGLARDVAVQLQGFTSPVQDQTVPFVAGKAVRSPKRTGGLKETRITFVDRAAQMIASRAGGDRGPVRPVEPERAVQPEPVPLARLPVEGDSAQPDVAGESRRPVGAGRAAAASTSSVTAAMEEPLGPGLTPLTRDSGGRGAVVPTGAGLGERGDDAPQGAAAPREEIAAVDVSKGATGPLAAPDLEKEAAYVQTSIFGEWWFWTAIGAGVALAAGGTTYFLMRDSTPSSGTLYAVW